MINEGSFVDVRGTSVFLRRVGSGEPLLFLHGAGGVGPWIPFYDRLAERFDLLVPDHPSYGRSPTPDWLDDIEDLALFYLDMLDSLDLSGVRVIGHSLGGWLSMEMATRSTKRIKSLTLMAPAGLRIPGKPAANVFFMDRTQLTNALVADPALAEQMLSMEMTPEQIDETVTNSIATARLAWHPRLFNPRLRKWLHRIDVPTHIVWGAEDQILPAAYAEEIGNLIDGSTVTMLPNIGHLPQIEDVDALMSTITEFFKRND
jgi:pimeloyl-ACP methyl ester carboxylesterase